MNIARKPFIVYILLTLLWTGCKLKETITPITDGTGLDDLELTFTHMSNFHMTADIDTVPWTMTNFYYDLDTGGYSISGWNYTTKGALHKDTIFHTITLDFVFPCVIETDTIVNTDDFFAYYTLDNNLANNNEVQFNALPGGYLCVQGIDTINHFVFGTFAFTGAKDTVPTGLRKIHTVQNGTFSFNYY